MCSRIGKEVKLNFTSIVSEINSESDYFKILVKILSLDCSRVNSEVEKTASGNLTMGFKKFDSGVVSLKQNCYSHINFSLRYLPEEAFEAFYEIIFKSMCDSLSLYNSNPDNKRELNSLANNSALAIGNLVLKIKKEIHISLGPIYKELNLIMNKKVLDKGLGRHCSLSLGKLGLVDPKSASEYLQGFIKPWCI